MNKIVLQETRVCVNSLEARNCKYLLFTEDDTDFHNICLWFI
jgi:hypothetical protein